MLANSLTKKGRDMLRRKPLAFEVAYCLKATILLRLGKKDYA